MMQYTEEVAALVEFEVLFLDDIFPSEQLVRKEMALKSDLTRNKSLT